MFSKNILIVGCFGGIGEAITKKCIKEGFNIFGLDVKDNFNIDGLHYYKVDVTKEEDIVNAYKDIRSEINDLYAIVSAVGIYTMDSLLEISDNDLKRFFDINVWGIQKIIKHFFSLLKKDSKILITTSEVGVLDPLPFNGLYTMSKSLLEKYAFSLRMEVNNFGIKVICYRPGAVSTNLLTDSTDSLDKFVNKTIIHKKASTKFKHIVDSVESKAITPEKNAEKVFKILKKKHPKYAYSINNNFLLKLLNILPARIQVAVISKILK